jgi:hypothetical protein
MAIFEAHKASDWFLKSVKTDTHGDVITLSHAGKVYVTRCAGTKFATSDKFFPDTRCPHLTQHVKARLLMNKPVLVPTYLTCAAATCS